VEYAMEKALSDLFDQTTMAIGGLDPETGAGNIESRNVQVFYERSKMGKSSSYNRAIQNVRDGHIFLISADTRFEDSVIGRMIDCLGDSYELAFPRIEPFHGNTLAEKLGEVMWHFHDSYMAMKETRDQFFCGGEFQIVRHRFIIPDSSIVNDDEYLCHRIVSGGGKIRYCRDVVVHNSVPGSMGQLMRQRVRVNFGHMQSRKLLGRHASFSISSLNPLETIAAIRAFNRDYPGNLAKLFLASIVEVLSLVRALIYRIEGRDLSNW
jgi:cellulose synthase/poly-beta-1,6-N-acetylglucosamine synthase-like glycosyltransferase